MKTSAFIALYSLFMLIIAACAPAPAPTPTPTDTPEVTLTVSGSSGVSSLLNAVQADFAAAAPGYTLTILSGTGTGGGVQGVVDGILDVAAMARSPKAEETEKGLRYLSFGSTGVAIMTHPGVTITDLSLEQLEDIYMGRITNWSELGGQDMEIILYVRDESESATIRLRELVFGDTPFPETTAGVLSSSGDMLASIEGTPGSIGFGNWIATAASSKKVKTLTLDGIAPSSDTYPITTPLGVGYVESRQTMVQPLLDWLVSETGQATLRKHGVINPPSA